MYRFQTSSLNENNFYILTSSTLKIIIRLIYTEKKLVKDSCKLFFYLLTEAVWYVHKEKKTVHPLNTYIASIFF